MYSDLFCLLTNPHDFATANLPQCKLHTELWSVARPHLEKTVWLTCPSPLLFILCSEDVTAIACSLLPWKLMTSFLLLPDLYFALTAPGLNQAALTHPDHGDNLWSCLGELAHWSPSGSYGWAPSSSQQQGPALSPTAVCSHFPGELPHRLETALLVNNWRWELPKDLGHLHLLAAAWLYISSWHHTARPQCSLLPASKLYEKAAKNTLNTFLMFLFHVNNNCGRKWLEHFCLVGMVHTKKMFKNGYVRPYYLTNKPMAKFVLRRRKPNRPCIAAEVQKASWAA